jgi:hypothetical protein
VTIMHRSLARALDGVPGIRVWGGSRLTLAGRPPEPSLKALQEPMGLALAEGAETARVDLAVEFSGVGRIEAIGLNRTANNLEHLAQGPNSTANVRGAATKHSESQKHNH